MIEVTVVHVRFTISLEHGKPPHAVYCHTNFPAQLSMSTGSVWVFRDSVCVLFVEKKLPIICANDTCCLLLVIYCSSVLHESMLFHIAVIVSSVHIGWSLNCSDLTCFISPGSQSFAEQIHKIAEHHNNTNFTVIVHQGIYNSTNGSHINFKIFKMLQLQCIRLKTLAVITCPAVSCTVSTINGIGIETSTDIVLSGLIFTNCSPVSLGLYIIECVNVFHFITILIMGFRFYLEIISQLHTVISSPTLVHSQIDCQI